MPYIEINWIAGRSEEQRRKLVESITKDFVEIANVPPESVNIWFNDIPKTHLGKKGKLVSDKE